MVDVTKQVAPENPFDKGSELMLTAPFDTVGLSGELAAAAPGCSIAIRAPKDATEPVSEDNPAWLHWSGPASAATMKKAVKAHDPENTRVSARSIGGSSVAQPLADVREKIQAGGTLDAIELTKAVAVLLGIPVAPAGS